jgi:hypothetical protein
MWWYEGMLKKETLVPVRLIDKKYSRENNRLSLRHSISTRSDCTAQGIRSLMKPENTAGHHAALAFSGSCGAAGLDGHGAFRSIL